VVRAALERLFPLGWTLVFPSSQMSSALAQEKIRRSIAALNVGFLGLSVAFVLRAFSIMPEGQLNMDTLKGLALPWTSWPWLIFIVSWWKSEGWRELGREFPRTATAEAWFFVGLNLVCALALIPYAQAGSGRDGWVFFFVLPLAQGALFTGLTTVVRLWRLLMR
jgi:hypothetical protein